MNLYFFIVPAVKLTPPKSGGKEGELQQMADNVEQHNAPFISAVLLSHPLLDAFCLDLGNMVFALLNNYLITA